MQIHTESERLIADYTENFIGKIFYFCLKRTGNSYDAEDLASDITLNVVSGLQKGRLPQNFAAWVWKIAHNRYCLWADRRHRYMESSVDIDPMEWNIADDQRENEGTDNEALSLLRRELAFISSDYREIVVAFYIEDRKVSDIAKSLGLPEGTVKSKLFRARKILKEGMTMAREFGARSYKPENISFSASGNLTPDRPWKAVQRNISKNIVLEANDNPSTLEELSIELGIALPYMEEEVMALEQATLLKKVGDKYVTNFFIASKECQLQVYAALRRSSAERSRMIDKIASDTLPKIRESISVPAAMTDDELKWLIVLRLTDTFLDFGHINVPATRSNGESWGFVGYESVEIPEKLDIGHNGTGNDDTMFWAYKIADYDLWDRVGEPSYVEALFLGEIIKTQRAVSSFTDVEKGIWRGIDGRFAHEELDRVVSDVPVITDNKKVVEIFTAHPLYESAKSNVRAAFDEIVRILKSNSNPVLEEQLNYYATMEMYKIRMMIVHDEVESGGLILPADPDKSRIAMSLHCK